MVRLLGFLWKPVLDEVMPSLCSYVQELAATGLPLPASLPKVEYFSVGRSCPESPGDFTKIQDTPNFDLALVAGQEELVTVHGSTIYKAYEH